MKPKLTPFALPLTEIRAADLPLVGGKGANLGEMTHAGFPVPPGFCLTTRAFKNFIDACPAANDLYDLLDSLGTDDLDAVRQAGETVRNTLLSVPVPDEIAEDLHKAWRATGREHAYAARSSATAEDLPDASFAGQQDTFLNLVGEEALLDAVRRCWVSLFTDRAILYRTRNDFPHREVQLSVVVQRMVLSEKSGILFTADPLTGHRYTTVIDASFGLGEALVGGLVTPDIYRVDTRRGAIIDRQVADKQVGIFPTKDGGTVQRELSEDERHRTVLEDAQILKLARTGTRIESHYGKPQDIEWAIDAAGEVFILQARPITSLYPIDGLRSPDGDLHVYFSMGHQQSMTRAMAPFGLSTMKVIVPIGHDADRFENTFVHVSGGRLFADITRPLRHPIARRALSAVLGQMDALMPEAIRQVVRRPDFQGPSGLHPNLAVVRFGAGIARQVIASLWWRDLDGFIPRTNRLMDAYIEDANRQLQAVPPGKPRLLAVLDLVPSLFPFFLNWVPEAAAGINATRILDRLSEKWLTADEREALTLGIPGNVVNEMNLAIGKLAGLARGCPELAAAFRDIGEDGPAWLARARQVECSGPFFTAWDDFMERYGMRGPAEIDLTNPRWYEDPLPLLHVIAASLQNESTTQSELQAGFVRGREAAFEKLIAAAGRGLLGGIRRRVLTRLYTVMVQVGGMREHHKLMAVRMLGVIKEVVKEAAAELVAMEKLAKPDDAWFLTWPELLDIRDDSGVDWTGRIEKRRAELARYQKLTPPVIITSDGETPVVRYRVEDAPPGALLGNPVSSGVVEGTVRVIHDPQRESLVPGEILVAEFTDPGWTPLFINAAGLVLEVGGALTHGAVVAREYGIPAVVGVRGATEALQTGQRIRVDGNRGVVEVLEE